MESDKITKQVVLHAPLSRVWQAITNAAEFGQWFGVKLDGNFAVGEKVTAMYPDQLTEELVLAQQKKLGLEPSAVKIPRTPWTFCTVEQIKPEEYFSFRWIPYGVDAEIDPENEPTTLVEFRLAENVDGTQLTITESGFDRVPAHRRNRAFIINVAGWAQQAERLKTYVESK